MNVTMNSDGLPFVSIIGVPNVGKSTLFNRLVGQRKAIVHKTPGVTRDRNIAETDWNGRRFFLVDTGGMTPPGSGELEREVEMQVRQAIEESDLILFLVDGRGEVLPVEYDIANMLRREESKVVLVANKVERPDDNSSYHAYSAIGLGEPFPVSAQRGMNCGDLLDAVIESLPASAQEERLRSAEVKVAVIGRPNAGKSSLINRVLGVERLVVHHEAGTTRDSIDTRIEYNGSPVLLIDTAGLRRKSRIEDNLEYYANVRVIRSIERADVVVLLVDGPQGIVRQDVNILSLAERRGKGMIISFSKWDLVGGRKEEYRDISRREIPHFAHVPTVFSSSVTGEGIEDLLKKMLDVGDLLEKRTKTALLNEMLGEAVSRRSPPASGTRPVKLLYISQVGTSPPEFVVFTSSTRNIKGGYERYLSNFLREELKLYGVPIRIKFRERKRRTRASK